MVTERACRDWNKWKSRLTDTMGGEQAKHERESDYLETLVQDTVGAVVCDSNGHMSAGVSRSVP